MLRRTADVDLGPHAEAWIREFGTGDDFEGQL
jgi:hypothetical protein